MSKANVSSSGSRILRVLKALRGHALNGVSNGELASALDESPANINRALNTLIEEGLALKLDNGRFAPGVQLLQIAMAQPFNVKGNPTTAPNKAEIMVALTG